MWMTPSGSRPFSLSFDRSPLGSFADLSGTLVSLLVSRQAITCIKFRHSRPRVITSMSKPFAVLPGFYNLLFLYLEPVSTVLPAFLIWFWPGWSWFHRELYPSSWPPVLGSDTAEDLRTKMAIWQLGSCEDTSCFALVQYLTLRPPGYCLLGMLEGFGLRAVRDALADNPVSKRGVQVRCDLTLYL